MAANLKTSRTPWLRISCPGCGAQLAVKVGYDWLDASSWCPRCGGQGQGAPRCVACRAYVGDDNPALFDEHGRAYCTDTTACGGRQNQAIQAHQARNRLTPEVLARLRHG